MNYGTLGTSLVRMCFTTWTFYYCPKNVKSVPRVIFLSQFDSGSLPYLLWNSLKQYLIDSSIQLLTIVAKNSLVDVDRDHKQKPVPWLASLKRFRDGNILHLFAEPAEVTATCLSSAPFFPNVNRANFVGWIALAILCIQMMWLFM